MEHFSFERTFSKTSALKFYPCSKQFTQKSCAKATQKVADSNSGEEKERKRILKIYPARNYGLKTFTLLETGAVPNLSLSYHARKLDVILR